MSTRDFEILFLLSGNDDPKISVIMLCCCCCRCCCCCCCPLQVIGTVATSAMAYNILRKASDEAVFDRAYRLTYNESQNRSDVFSLAGAAGMAMLAFRLPMSYGPAACAGIGLGVVAHCAYKPFAKREP